MVWLAGLLVAGGCAGEGGAQRGRPIGAAAASARERAYAGELQRLVRALASDIGPRSMANRAGLVAAADWIERELRASGLTPTRQRYQVRGAHADNVEARLPGVRAGAEIVVVGAHYDAVPGTPGANDNASGVAAALVMARALARLRAARELRFVFFANEEPPHFQTETMGSLVYARACRARGDRIVAMMSLDTIGYYSDQEGSQRYPAPLGLFYPGRGDFVAFVGDNASAGLVKTVERAFRAATPFPVQAAALSSVFPGVGWSDHWSFWQVGYHAMLVTDTAPFRYPHYHDSSDTPDRLSYDRLAAVVAGLERVFRVLVSTGTLLP